MLYFIWNRWEIHLYWKYRKMLKYSKRSQFSRFPDVTVYWNPIFCIGFLLVYNSYQTLTRCLTLSQKTPSNFSKLNPSLVKLVRFRTNLMESIQNKYVRILGTTEWLNSSENKFISMPVVKIDYSNSLKFKLLMKYCFTRTIMFNFNMIDCEIAAIHRSNNRSKWLNNCFVPLTTISLSKAFRILTIRLCKAAQDHDVTCIPWMRVSVGFVASSIIRLLPHGQQLCTKCIFTKEFVYCYCEECISSKWTSLAAIITL